MQIKEPQTITGKIKVITTCSKTGKFLRETVFTPNRIMLGTDTGKTLILQRLIGNNAFSLNITHGDIGTSSTAPLDANTQLIAPTTRVPITNSSITANVASLFFFFSNANLANGTYREFGTFVDGTSTISTGRIFNRALFTVAYVKATGEDTTIQLEITIT